MPAPLCGAARFGVPRPHERLVRSRRSSIEETPPCACSPPPCSPRALSALPAQAQIRNAPGPRALEFAAYIFAASNVCGYRIGTDTFEALLAKQNTSSADVNPRGPFGGRVQSMFALMSNDMAQHRDQACLAVAGEYGPRARS